MKLKSVKHKVYDEPINKRWKHVQYHVLSPVDTLVRRMICDQIGSAIIDLWVDICHEDIINET